MRVVITKEKCPECDKVKQSLKNKGVAYKEIAATTENYSAVKEVAQLLGVRSFPIVLEVSPSF